MRKIKERTLKIESEKFDFLKSKEQLKNPEVKLKVKRIFNSIVSETNNLTKNQEKIDDSNDEMVRDLRNVLDKLMKKRETQKLMSPEFRAITDPKFDIEKAKITEEEIKIPKFEELRKEGYEIIEINGMRIKIKDLE